VSLGSCPCLFEFRICHASRMPSEDGGVDCWWSTGS
jgi:hypothetical protein